MKGEADGRLRWPTLALAAAFAAISLWINLAIKPYDVTEYRYYAHAALLAPWFHHWPREYPALSLAVFLLPLLLPMPYRAAFGVVAAVGLVALLGASRKVHDRTGWAIRLLVYLTAGSIAVFSGRYDVFAAVAGFLAVESMRRGRWAAAWSWSVLGFWLKLFPVVFWPVFLIAEWRAAGRWRWDRLGAAAALALVPTVLQVWVAPHAAFSAFRYLLDRPLEVGSLPAGLAAFVAPRYDLFGAYASVNVASGWDRPMAVLVSVAAIGAWGMVFWGLFRGRLKAEQAATLALLVLLLGSKVFSAQYLIWLAPMLAYWPLDFRFVVAYMLTTVGYPLLFEVPHWFGAVVWVFLFRNILLVWGGVAWARRWWRTESVLYPHVSPQPTKPL